MFLMLIPLPEIGFPDLIAKRTIFEDLGQISLSWGHIPFKKVNDKLCKVSFYSTLFFFLWNRSLNSGLCHTSIPFYSGYLGDGGSQELFA
jgi:hypothetical protein